MLLTLPPRKVKGEIPSGKCPFDLIGVGFGNDGLGIDGVEQLLWGVYDHLRVTVSKIESDICTKIERSVASFVADKATRLPFLSNPHLG